MTVTPTKLPHTFEDRALQETFDAIMAKIGNGGGGDSGDLKSSAAAIPPDGWLLCDGAAVSRTTYADLFAAIATAYGAGDGVTTFNVPDLRGRTPIGAGTGAGLTARALGAQVGVETHTLTLAQMAAHDHGGSTGTGATGTGTTGGMNANNPHGHTNGNGGSGILMDGTAFGSNANLLLGGGSYQLWRTNNIDINHGHSVPSLSVPALSIGSAGGGGAHPNMQPSLAVNWLIKT